jgi:hypothetical protein
VARPNDDASIVRVTQRFNVALVRNGDAVEITVLNQGPPSGEPCRNYVCGVERLGTRVVAFSVEAHVPPGHTLVVAGRTVAPSTREQFAIPLNAGLNELRVEVHPGTGQSTQTLRFTK